MIASDPKISQWSTVITPVVLAGVVLSELVGPLLVRFTLEKGGEVEGAMVRDECGGLVGRACEHWLKGPDGVRLAPWDREPLHPPANTEGVVVFGVSHTVTSRALARITTILAHHYHAMPMGVRVLDKSERGKYTAREIETMFLPERDETESLGYTLQTELIYDSVASGLVSAVEYNNARAVVLGYPLGRNPLAFQKVLDKVAANVLCPVIAVRFVGTLSCRRLLVPFLFPQELDELLPICEALAEVGHPRITFLQMLHADCSREEVRACEQFLNNWLEINLVDSETRIRVEAADSRLETILDAAHYHDLIIMTAARRHKIQRMFFGSLANSVVHNCKNPVFVIYTPQDGIA